MMEVTSCPESQDSYSLENLWIEESQVIMYREEAMFAAPMAANALGDMPRGGIMLKHNIEIQEDEEMEDETSTEEIH